MDTVARIQLGFVLTLLSVVTVVVLQNRFPVLVKLLFWSTRVDLVLLLVMVFVTGLLSGWVMGWLFRRRSRTPPA
jgi:ribose/xylose/arabinose/galactoside ABC-type transport system permease subunit